MQKSTPSLSLEERVTSSLQAPAQTKTNSHSALRFGAVLPLAALFTIGLTISMATLIATEFAPQDKSKTASFEINPLADEIKEPPRTEKPDQLKKVETPPPPPVVATYQTAAVDLPIIEIVGKKTEIDLDKLDLGQSIGPIEITRPTTPIVRVPPVFPARFLQGDVSGYCRVRFDINPEGKPYNVETTTCTNPQLQASTIRSVRKWEYAPEVQDGRPVTRSGLETTIRFDLTDERGEILPLPQGY